MRSAAAPNETAPPITKVEVEESEAVTSLKDKKTPGVDNIQGELLKHGGGEVIDYREAKRFTGQKDAKSYSGSALFFFKDCSDLSPNISNLWFYFSL